MEKDENKTDVKIEKEIYRSCLKQVVNFLNTTLPPIIDSEESDNIPVKTTEKKIKKSLKKEEDLRNSYRIKDTVPTRIMSEKTVKNKTDKQTKKRRLYNKSKQDFNFKSKKPFDKKKNL